MSDHEPMPEGEEAPPPGVRTMALVRWGLVILMGLIAATSVLHYAGLLTPTRHAAAVQYYCPMHPSVVQDQPGECPICNMSLVPREAGAPQVAGARAVDGAEAADSVPGLVAVELTPERVQLLGMRTAAVTRRALARELRVVGFVAASEPGLVRVHTRFAGWIETLAASQTGQRVRRGDVLATIYSPELFTTQQELLNARRWASPDAHAEALPDAALIEGARRRLELLGVASEDVREIEHGGHALRAVPLRAPADGWVLQKNAVAGLYVEPGTELFEIADLSSVWVLADVPEHDVARVGIGAAAHFAPAAFSGETFAGRVEFLAPTLDPDTRTLRVRLALANPDLRLRPGMYGDVLLDLPGGDALAVPREAVVDTGTLQYVFLARPGGRFEPRRVRLGARAGDDVEVLAGLAEGDTVVTTANFLIDSESRLRAAIGGVAAAEASDCDREFDRARYPEKYDACRACEVQHRGMGSMVDDCKRAISKPWR